MAVARTITLPGDGQISSKYSGSILFVGTATTVITCGGFTILTDPNFLHSGDHAHLGYGLTSRRRTNPALEIEDLPHLDLCLLSHLHGDHWDRVAEAKLSKALPIVTTVHAAKALGRKGFDAVEGLDTWESVTVVKGEAHLRITAMPGRHGPGVVNALLPSVMGSLLEWGKGDDIFRLYISGDTLMHDELSQVPKRYPNINLALLHLGGTKVLGVLVTMDARQGIEAIRLIRPRTAIPIHYNDYTVFKSSLEDFQKAVREAGLEDRVHYLNHGDTYIFTMPGSRET
ncbi:MBL fold metallo-hydrolase [Geobacter sp. DSM 9736]|uniref:MBL fold metallo-hydrolase n=1 Tax=Geobacter sp. DSM 9736 TaxID=1277350 RepID=UPI000B5087B6|nr:MBL fold metallo-hydrolase [Geobacter sp. DSM 9736]SNB46822.1 L-ascorbate metabolism protein UlaG, beta-lactamase superfamily [Geobacter sp. DSM 9736]